MRSEGVSFTAAAENLGLNSILSLDSGRPFLSLIGQLVSSAISKGALLSLHIRIGR